MNGLEEIGHNDNFWVKMAWAKKERTIFLPKLPLGNYSNRLKSFNKQNQKNQSMSRLREIGQDTRFWVNKTKFCLKNGQI